MIVEEQDINRRIDSFLSEKLELSRSKVQKLIKDEKVYVNGKIVSSNYKIKLDDVLEVEPEIEDFDSNNLVKENIPLDIIYEDEYLLVINKKSGMVTHPAPGNYTGTLVNALLYRFDLTNDLVRPGIVHRLDKDTSGLMVVAKDEKTLELLSNMIKEKKIERHYLALVEGLINHETGTIDAPIGRDINNRKKMAVTDINSKAAITHFKVLKRYAKNTLIECILDTGRTHQIRVHMSYIGHPVVNDPLYNNKKSDEFGQMLHSKSIKFIHPITNKLISYEKEPPKEFLDRLKLIDEDEII